MMKESQFKPAQEVLKTSRVREGTAPLKYVLIFSNTDLLVFTHTTVS